MHRKSDFRGGFLFEQPEGEAVGSVLYEEHLKLVSKSRFAEFAGYLMPLWFSSIAAEHEAVRTAAGVFDCTHMGVLEMSGPGALGFLNIVTTNDVSALKTGAAQYSYILDAAGNVLDDIIVYCLDEDRFMVVVNAANEAKIKAYIAALLKNEVLLDVEEPGKKLEYRPKIRDMRDTRTGANCRVDIALQGPVSADILLDLAEDDEAKEQIEKLRPFRVMQAAVGGIDCIIAHTGYTGSRVGCELFVHPEKASALWSTLLKRGATAGLVPCGLGARDSLRIEAGLPLYGHELDGPFNISPFEAGYPWAVKLEKEFFIGKRHMAERANSFDSEVVRLELPGQKGVRPARQNDAVLDSKGKCLGWILSCATAGERQVALALVTRDALCEGAAAGVYYLARSANQVEQGRKEEAGKGEALAADIKGRVLSRFERF